MEFAGEFLLDTDTCIYLLNGEDRVRKHVANVGVENLSICILTEAELCFGAYNSNQPQRNLQRIRAFLTPPAPHVLPIDGRAAEEFGRLKADLRGRGRIIGDIDLLIASVALTHGLTVVTNNIAHFERISGLPIANWLE